MRVISYPGRTRRSGPRPPLMILTWWMPVGTIVEHNGEVWKKVWKGAADQEWTEWEVYRQPMPTKPPKGGSGISRPNANWTKKGRR